MRLSGALCPLCPLPVSLGALPSGIDPSPGVICTVCFPPCMGGGGPGRSLSAPAPCPQPGPGQHRGRAVSNGPESWLQVEMGVQRGEPGVGQQEELHPSQLGARELGQTCPGQQLVF